MVGICGVVNNLLVYYIAPKKAGVPSRNALRRGKQACLPPSSHEVFDHALGETWLRTMGMISEWLDPQQPYRKSTDITR